MIKRLRDRPLVHNDRTESRRKVSVFGRWIYIGLLSMFFVWVFDLFLGPLLRLRADGLVVAEHLSISVPFPAQVLDVAITPGARVTRGHQLSRVHSVEIVQNLAVLTARHAELQTTRVDIERRARVAKAVLAVADDRAGEAVDAVRRIRDYRETGNIAIITWSQALQEQFNAKERMAAMTEELRSAEAGLITVDAALANAAGALGDLKRVYNDGIVVAPEDGIIGLRTARPGDVVPVGGSLMVLYRPQPHVLAYLETGTLYAVAPGDEVRVSDGFTNTIGRVAEVLPVADALPEEFRKAFQPRGRSQVARIELRGEAPFPLFAKVRLTGIGWLSTNSAVRLWLDGVIAWSDDARATVRRLAAGAYASARRLAMADRSPEIARAP